MKKKSVAAAKRALKPVEKRLDRAWLASRRALRQYDNVVGTRHMFLRGGAGLYERIQSARANVDAVLERIIEAATACGRAEERLARAERGMKTSNAGDPQDDREREQAKKTEAA